MDWLTAAHLERAWPALGSVGCGWPAGGGLRLETATGIVHLKRRPPERMGGELWVLEHAGAAGLPVTTPVRTRDGAAHLVVDETAWFVYRERPGTPLPRLLDGPGEAERAGAACARLGLTLAALDVAEARAAGVPDRPESPAAVGLGAQVIHRDVHPGNMLVADGEVTGWIDFDHVEIGPRLVDLVYLAGSVLSELVPLGRADEFGGRWDALVHGYQGVAPLTDAERAAAPALLLEVERDFLAWFRATGDQAGAALTAEMIALIEAGPMGTTPPAGPGEPGTHERAS